MVKIAKQHTIGVKSCTSVTFKTLNHSLPVSLALNGGNNYAYRIGLM